MTLKDRCPILQFADLGDERGKLVVIEGGQAIPFDIKRVFYIYDSDSTVVRGQHANKESEFVLINVAGRSKVRITDGKEEYIVCYTVDYKEGEIGDGEPEASSGIITNLASFF